MLKWTKGITVSNILYIVATIAIGASLSLQPPINAVMANTLGSPLLAASISIAISLVIVIVVWLTWGNGEGQLTLIPTLPWWIILGGVIGVVIVVGGVMIAPVLGMALFFVCIVTGQLIGSALADQVGAFGMEIKPLNTMKLAGLGLVLAGAAMVQHSNG